MSFPVIRADRLQMKQVVINLMTNAKKYSQRVDLLIGATHLADGRAMIVFSDRGYGMTLNQIQIALQPYGRVISSDYKDIPGSGLGLPICNTIIRHHGGQFFINSDPAVGSSFFVTLPKSRIISWARPTIDAAPWQVNDFDLDRIDGMDDAAFDRLPFGAIELALDGTVLRYNDVESRLTGLAADRVLGRNFFREVAPCTQIQEFEGRFRAGIAAGDMNEVFEFTFPFKRGATRVLIQLRMAKARETCWVFVRWA
jgi:photoactive yellow protein